jgi:hypothetical protein
MNASEETIDAIFIPTPDMVLVRCGNKIIDDAIIILKNISFLIMNAVPQEGKFYTTVHINKYIEKEVLDIVQGRLKKSGWGFIILGREPEVDQLLSVSIIILPYIK